MTPRTPERQHRLSGNWKHIQRTQPRPGEWVQTRNGWEKVAEFVKAEAANG